MNTSTCSECHRVFSNGGEHGWFSGTCPDCIRQKKGQAEASRQAAAVIANAESQTHAAWHAANATIEAAHQTASAQVEAVRREADAKERFLDAQAEAALANSVGQLSAEGLQRVHDFKKLEEDRANIQMLFDNIGNCIACIDGKGNSTEHFQVEAYSNRDPIWVSLKERNGTPAAYRYHNLRAAIAKLRDLREEITRIRTWDAHQSRDVTLQKIAGSIELAERHMLSAAKTIVAQYVSSGWKRMMWYMMWLGIFSTCLGLCFFGGLFGSIPLRWSKCADWDEIEELARG